MRPPSHASGLTRKSTGLTTAHVELIKLLAEIAVTDYLREQAGADEAPGHEPEAVTTEEAR